MPRAKRSDSGVIFDGEAVTRLFMLGDRGTKASVVADMIDKFIDYLPTRLNAIDTAVKTKDKSELYEQANALRSVAGAFGLLELAEAAGALERLSRASAFDSAKRVSLVLPVMSRNGIKELLKIRNSLTV